MGYEYQINPAERLKELLPSEEYPSDVEITYSFHQGYEELNINHHKGGGYNYQGAYHPDGSCSAHGVCVYCGSTNYSAISDSDASVPGHMDNERQRPTQDD